jgi:hypothetical protein
MGLARLTLESSFCFTGKGCRRFPANPGGPGESRVPSVETGLETKDFGAMFRPILSNVGPTEVKLGYVQP